MLVFMHTYNVEEALYTHSKINTGKVYKKVI